MKSMKYRGQKKRGETSRNVSETIFCGITQGKTQKVGKFTVLENQKKRQNYSQTEKV